MENGKNVQSLNVLTDKIKALEEKCKEQCNIIGNNSSMEIGTINSSNSNDKKLSYVESLAETIKHAETPIPMDSNVNTILFLKEITEKISQVEEVTAFTAGAVQDVENENNRIRANIKMVQEAKARLSGASGRRREVRPEHLQNVKQRFRAMKADLQGLLRSIFPESSDAVTEVLGELMGARMKDETGGYIHVTPDNSDIIQLLKDMKIVSPNPNNNMEVKLLF